MFARFFATSLIVLSFAPAISAAPDLEERGSGRFKTDVPTLINNVDPDMTGMEGVPRSAGSGSRFKGDRLVLTKSGVTYDLYLKTDRGLSFYGTYDRNEAAATADRLRLDDETVACLRSNSQTFSACPTNF